MPSAHYRAGQLTYRPVGSRDGPSLAAVLADPLVAQWLRPAGRDDPYSLRECAERAAADAAHWRAHGFGPWLVLDRDEVVAHGGLRLKLVGASAELEVAWAVASRRWRRGIASDIARCAFELALERGAGQVIGLTRRDNHASRRLMEKLGMGPDAELRYAGLPHVLYRKRLEANRVASMAATDTSMIVTGVDFVSVPTQDLERAVAFYGTTLGLPRSAYRPERNFAEFETGTVTLSVVNPARMGIGEFRPNANYVALHVEDVAAARAELERRGVTFAGDIFDTGVCHMAFFTDPDGNALMLHHRYAPRVSEA